MRRLLARYRWLTVGLLGISVSVLNAACSNLQTRTVGPHVNGVLTGKVTDAVTRATIPGVAIRLEPSAVVPPILADVDGSFYAEVPPGPYRVTFNGAGYRESRESITVAPGRKAAANAVLDPVAPVVVYAGKDVSGAKPGSTVTFMPTVTVRDGSKVNSIRWTLVPRDGRVAPSISQDSEGATARLPDAADYEKVLVGHLERNGKLLDRWMVVGVSPSDVRDAGTVTLSVEVETTSGTYSDTVDVVADLGALVVPNPGLQTVPVGELLLLQGREQDRYSWTLTRPPGSAAALKGSTSRNPRFTPDLAGTYTVAEGGKTRLTIYAGTWTGIIVSEEKSGRRRWVGSDGCLCHYKGPVTPKFEAWQNSGHADIFDHNLDFSYRYEESCFVCHTVGFNKSASNSGMDDVQDFRAFVLDKTLWDRRTDPALVKPAPGNRKYLREKYPGVARLANVQCESCHGPNESPAHKTWKKTGASERITLSSVLCGVCHDESLGPSYPEWLRSEHANYRLAIETSATERRGEAARDCGRCHAARGFLAWVAGRDRSRTIQGKGGDATLAELDALGLTADKVHPITCAVCHEPHNPGNPFRVRADKVPVRVGSDSPFRPSEFSGPSGGRGELCIACHSTASGPYNDEAMARVETDTAPHPAQGDVLLGQNAFFVPMGTYRSHARIEDTCISCHMKPIPQRPELGFPRSHADHTFKAPSNLCSRCHAGFDAQELSAATEADMKQLKTAIERAIKAEIAARRTVTLVKALEGKTDLTLTPDDIRTLKLMEAGEEMGVEIGDRAGRNHRVPLSRIHPGGAPFLPTANGQVVAKAAWNYLLAKSDASMGLHNPRFVSEMLGATLAKIGAVHPSR